MKAITICQPYAHLIALPDDHKRMKRVENRTWGTMHRGAIAIHAGKSRKFMDVEDGIDVEYDIPVADMAFGEFVAIADLLDCVPLGMVGSPSIQRRFPWLHLHEHAEGPVCWVLGNVRKLETPIPYRGAQGLWDVPDPVVLDCLKPAS